MGRQLPIECEHGKIIDGGDFCDSEICPQCDFDPIGVEISGTETASLEDKYTALKAQHEALVEAADKYHDAVIRRNTTAYPEPTERVEIAEALDETQDELFEALSAALAAKGEG